MKNGASISYKINLQWLCTRIFLYFLKKIISALTHIMRIRHDFDVGEIALDSLKCYFNGPIHTCSSFLQDKNRMIKRGLEQINCTVKISVNSRYVCQSINTTWWRKWSWKLHGKLIRSCDLIGPVRSFQRNNGHATHQGKQNWPIGGCAILYTALSLYEIIKWHHTHRNSLYKQWKLGRIVTDTISTAVSGFFVVLVIYCLYSAKCWDNGYYLQ